MNDLTPYSLFLPFLLYAETHYRFRYFFSYLKKSEPEILFDAPHWIEPHQPIPLLLLCKDAHLYPCRLLTATAHLSQNDKTQSEISLLDSPLNFDTPYWWKVFQLNVTPESGWLEIDIEFELEVKGKKITYRNDNYRTSSQSPLRIYKASQPQPRIRGLSLGDCHTHSTYTEDQVEYGSPLEASVQLSKSMGLSYFCVTDHSYDLDDKTDNYLVNDVNLPKWKRLQDDVDRINTQETNFAIVRGEEVSCRNRVEQNVHLLLVGNRTYVPGAGDSAEQWLKTKSELSIKDVLQMKHSATLAIAAHPSENVPLIQRLLLGRGEWTEEDFRDDRLTGIQFLNGHRDAGFFRGYQHWVKCLLRGQRVFVFGGNDAHGNFNRFRQIAIPFLKLLESDRQLFGKAKTGVYLAEPTTETNIIHGLGLGKTIITDGPVINLRLNESSEITSIGKVMHAMEATLHLEAVTSEDFGEIERLLIYKGIIEEQHEELIYSNSSIEQVMTWRSSLSLEVSQPMYIRAEVYTRAANAYDGRSHFALTNPVWFTPR